MSDAAMAPVLALDAAARRLETPCGDGAMAWRVWGEGPPVVLLHGGYGSWAHWVRNVRPLAAAGWRVIAADLPGLGQSATPPEPHTVPALAAILTQGLERVLDGRPAPLVGFSFGGILAGEAALAAPHLVERLVLVGSAGMGLRRDPPPEDLQPERPGMSDEEVATLQRRNLAILMFHDPAKIDDLAVRLQILHTRQARVRSRPLSRGDSLARALQAGRPRLAGIWGEFDRTAYPHLDQRRALFAEVDPAAPFVTIPGAGHWVAYEAAEAFNKALLELLGAPR